MFILLLTLAQPAHAAAPVPFDQIEQLDGILYVKGTKTPFTGVAERTFPDGRKTRTHFVDGIGTGLSTLWHANGQKAVEVNLENNVPHGVMTKWNETGEVVSEVRYEHGKPVERAQDRAP